MLMPVERYSPFWPSMNTINTTGQASAHGRIEQASISATFTLIDALLSLEMDHHLLGVENKLLYNWKEFVHLLFPLCIVTLLFCDMEGSLNCSFNNCTTEDNTLLVKIPAAIPMPIKNKGRVPIVLYRQKRGFGITTAAVVPQLLLPELLAPRLCRWLRLSTSWLK